MSGKSGKVFLKTTLKLIRHFGSLEAKYKSFAQCCILFVCLFFLTFEFSWAVRAYFQYVIEMSARHGYMNCMPFL